VENHYPNVLFKHLTQERGYKVAETGPGIYTVSGDILPIQVIDSSKLPLEENLWLKNLSNKLDYKAIGQVSAEAERQGKARGEERKAFGIARNLIKMGLPVEAVVSATELDPEKVKALYNNS